MFQKNIHPVIILIAAAALHIAALVWDNFDYRDRDHRGQVHRFVEVVKQKVSRTQDEFEKLYSTFQEKGYQETIAGSTQQYTELFQDEGILLHVFRGDSLIFWNGNTVPVDQAKSLLNSEPSWSQFPTGWYRVVTWTRADLSFVGLITVKRTYPYENKYLENRFQKDFNLPATTRLFKYAKEESYKYDSPGGVKPIYLKFEKRVNPSAARQSGIALLWALSWIFWLFGTGRLAMRIRESTSPLVASILVILLVAGARLALLNFTRIDSFDSLQVFDPSIYSTSVIFPSLFDFFFNAALLTYIAFFIRFSLFQPDRKHTPVRGGILLALCTTATLGLAFLVNSLTQGLVENSSINFELNNILEVDAFTILGIVVLGLLYLSYAVLAELSVSVARREAGLSKPIKWAIAGISAALFLVLTISLQTTDPVRLLWPFLAIAVIGLSTRNEKALIAPGSAIGLVILFSALSAYILFNFSQAKEKKERLILAEKLAADDDPIAEWLYPDLQKRLLADPRLEKMFPKSDSLSSEELGQILIPRHFTGYWGRYHVDFQAFNADSSRWGRLPSVKTRGFNEINELLAKKGTESPVSPNFYHLYMPSELFAYLIRLPYVQNSDTLGYLVFDLRSKVMPDEVGFPELLTDRRARTLDDLSNYSNAKYVNGNLVNHRGPYPYPLILSEFQESEKQVFEFRKNEYEHLLYRVSNATSIAVSKPSSNLFDLASSFSYLLAILGLVYLITSLIYWHYAENRYPWNSLTGKIQLLLGAFSITTVILFGIASRENIQAQYREKNSKIIAEKLQSLQIELRSKVGTEKSLGDEYHDYLNQLLSKFSYIFFTDINLYNPDGSLLATSQPRIFTEGLLSRHIDPLAFVRLKYDKQSQYVHEEQVGSLSFLSAYVPFENEDGELLAYLNLPYFAQQSELDQEVAQFYVAIINIFMLLFILSLLAALFASNWITRPIRQIRQALARMDIGGANKMLHYRGQDEIARLVAEYNSKVAELEMNADKLARSEREMAWREMARQVAHEIKNPLTPMKLSVQHLERSAEDNSPEQKERLQRITGTLIEQIDTLSSIASAFSDFAKMPVAKNEKLDLSALLNRVTNLYDDTPGIEIKRTGHMQPAIVYSDRDQLLRVFNNLIKNAIQAIPSNQKGEITVDLEENKEQWIARLTDNGAGIPEELRNRIFEPNFTTKSRGTGLGLAMAKKIVESADGQIGFESSESGTTFYIILPKYSEEAS